MSDQPDGRYELKYVLPRGVAAQIAGDLAEFLRPDPLGDESGAYFVASLYFDSEDSRCYWAKVNGHRFRRKLRIRIYGIQITDTQSPCHVEIKQRNNQATQKRRVILPYSEAIALCGAGRIPDVVGRSGSELGILDEMRAMHTRLGLRETCVVSYRRLALMSDDPVRRLRVTFDTDLTCRNWDLSLCASGTANRLLFPPDVCIMEVKTTGTAPLWLSHLLAIHRCALRRVSKYCCAIEACHHP